jgi:ring-1,2-phenylacetyl-CoA epoxidase subunit PaaE
MIMQQHFHPLTVRDIRKETDDCISVSFDIPPDLSDAFRFRQGQNITLRKQLKGEELRRNYSICSSPLEAELRIAIKRVPHGRFSNWANTELKAGDVLEVWPPTGKFHTELDPALKRNYLAFAAGSGITPILSIIRTTLQTEPGSRFTLVYGNRNRRSIIFREQLEDLKNRYMQRFNVIHILSREEPETLLNSGRIDEAKCAELAAKMIDLSRVDEVFLCGPEDMIFTVKNFLETKGFPEKHIHFELFTTPRQKEKALALDRNERPAGEHDLCTIKVRIDGVVTQFELPAEGDTILNAALRAGADLPYACKGGVCATCKAKLIEGEVDMDVNYALEGEEVKNGFILTCQSHPKTAQVFVDFDAR